LAGAPEPKPLRETTEKGGEAWTWGAKCESGAAASPPLSALQKGPKDGAGTCAKSLNFKIKKLENLGLQFHFGCAILPNMKIVLNLKGALH